MRAAIKYICFRSKRTFGVELEASPNISKASIRDIICSVSDRKVRVTDQWEEANQNDHWLVKYDATCGVNAHLKPDGKDRGWEVNSYVASGFKDILHIACVADTLSRGGLQVNQNCGLHIHVGIGDFSSEQAGILLANWMKIEPIICCMVPQNRVGNKHCRLWTADSRFDRFGYYGSPATFWEHFRPTDFRPHENSQKKMTLNFVHYAKSISEGSMIRPTVELRIPEGTLDGRQISNWVRFMVHFIEHSRAFTEMPSLTTATLGEFMSIVGLEDQKDFCLLSRGLYQTKVWVLERILSMDWTKKESRCNHMRSDAEAKLDRILRPRIKEELTI